MAISEDVGVVSPKKDQDTSGSTLDKTAIVQEAYQQIEDAADRLIANGDSLWKIKQIVEAKRSTAKTADFNRKIKSILGPSTTVEVRFVSYSYDETIFGDEKHYLEWDILRASDENETAKKDDSPAKAVEDDSSPSVVSSYRFSFRDPLDMPDLKLPGDWGNFEFFRNTITYKKGYDSVGYWTIPCLDQIHKDEMMKRMIDDGNNAKADPNSKPDSKFSKFSFANTLAQMEKHRDEVGAIAREKYEKAKAETPEFSFRTAVPGLFQEMSNTLGVSETDAEKALDEIKALAEREIYFDDVFESSPATDQQCQSCNKDTNDEM
jgi:hypothetical protein